MSAPPPSNPAALPRAFRIGEWRVRPELHRLAYGTSDVQVEPRIMAVLVRLAERPGEVLTRDELLDAVWGDVVVQEEALTHAISRLRRTFGDDPRAPRYIETIPKRGYRLVAEVRPDTPVDKSAAPALLDPPQVAPAVAPTPPARRGMALARAGAAVATLVVAALWWNRSPAPSAPAVLTGLPLTSYPGREVTPALSPDGTRIAFAWDGGEEEGFDLYVVQRGTASPLRLTETPELVEHSPTWSPDGAHLAYLAEGDDGTMSVHRVPALGGAPRPLFTTPAGGGLQGVDWHPTEDWLLVSLTDGANEPWTLHRLPLDGGAPVKLFAPPGPPGPPGGDTLSALSPDGTRVAFLRGKGVGFADVHVAALDGSDVRRLTHGQGQIRGLDWRADGSAVVVSAGTAFAGEFRLWSVEVATSAITWLPTRGKRSLHPSIAAATGALVYAEETYHRHLVQTHLGSEAGASPPPSAFARSSASEYDAHHSPTGNRVAFVSTRSGHPEVWVCDRDDGAARRVTSFGGAHVEFLQWSGDERFLAFDATTDARSAIHIADVERGTTRALTDSSSNEVLLGWARDDAHLYLQSLEGTEWRTLRASLATGETEEVLPFRAHMLAETADGTGYFYVKEGTSALWRADLDGGNEHQVLDVDGAALCCYWKATPTALLHYRNRDGGLQLASWSFADGEVRELLTFPEARRGLIDVSLDGRSVLYDVLDRVEADLVLVE